MWAGDRCPHCGCPLGHGGGGDPERRGAGDAGNEVDIDQSIELLHAEVVELRATVARLRGSGFTGVASTGTGRH
jgi:hypothetical protein